MTDALGGIDWGAELARHSRWLRTVIAARVGSEATDDILQEVAAAAIRQAAPVRDAEKVAPWLYQLAVRQSLMYRRKMGRQRKLMTRYADASAGKTQESDTGHDPLSWLLKAERDEIVRRAVASLPRRDGEILTLKHSEGWTYDQLGKHLGISRSAVEARLHRARQRLRAELVRRNLSQDETAR